MHGFAATAAMAACLLLPVIAPATALAATAAPKDCTKLDASFKRDRGHPVFVTELRNECGQRMRCKVYVSIVSSREHLLREHALTLAATGARATGSYRLPVKLMGGGASASHECRAA